MQKFSTYLKKGSLNYFAISRFSTQNQRQYFVGGNWKCNGTVAFTKEMIEGTLNKVEYNKERVQVCIAPSSVHLQDAKNLAKNNILVAAQNCGA